jgi:rhamnogalacturonyl hydrolase YesR
MLRRLILSIFVSASAVILFSGCGGADTDIVDNVFGYAEKQLAKAVEVCDSVMAERWAQGDTVVAPHKYENGELMMLKPKSWTSGFFAGSLWYMYEYTGQRQWKDAAMRFTSYIESEKKNGNTHDLGFKIGGSFGNGYRLTSDPAYRDVLIEAAYTLAGRFNPNVGCTLSWSWGEWKFPVIIDNMMNLELLFVASKLTGDKALYDIAVSHAQTTMKNHFREDASCWHVVDYDPQTGGVVGRMTWQGYNDDSTWARGEGWALYGYSMCYRETGNQEFLDHARKVARYILDHPNLPGDMVVYWDFDDPDIPNSTRDVSAAAVMASAFYELSTLDQANAKEFKAAADTMVKNIYDLYREGPGNKAGFILDHSRGARKFEIDVPLVYADYYFLEALLRKRNIENK